MAATADAVCGTHYGISKYIPFLWIFDINSFHRKKVLFIFHWQNGTVKLNAGRNEFSFSIGIGFRTSECHSEHFYRKPEINFRRNSWHREMCRLRKLSFNWWQFSLTWENNVINQKIENHCRGLSRALHLLQFGFDDESNKLDTSSK